MRHLPRSPTPLPQSPQQGLSDSNTKHTHTHTHTHAHTHTHTHTGARAYIHTHTHTLEASCYVSVYTCCVTHTHIYMHTHTHKHTHTLAHTHTCVLPTIHEEDHTCYPLKVPQKLFLSRSTYGGLNNVQPIYKQHPSSLTATRARSLRAYDNFYTMI